MTTTYGYNAGGDLATTAYSDATPAVTNTFDRRGRTIQTVVGTSSTSSVIFNDAGNLLSEFFTVGPLSGLRLTNTYDSLLRRASVSLLNGSTLLTSSTNAYDAASRLSSVTFGTNSATYAYLTNSALVDNLIIKSGATTRMTTSNKFDNLNRLTRKASQTGAVAVATFGYTYNAANQRTAITNADSSRWSYGYDSLGQVTSGKRYWSDGNIVAGQQFEYTFDDIGNRKTAASGGDEWGVNLRYENYSANSLNQYTQRTVPPYVNVLGAATNFATVTVNLQPTYRKGEYFRAELGVDNSSSPLWFGITNVGVLTNGGGPNIVSTNTGNLLVAKATETYFNDLDGNQTSDSLWTNSWNGENRLISTESASGVPSAGKAKETWNHLPDGRWIERVVANWNGSTYTNAYTNRFIWDGQVLLAIVDHTNGLVTSFVRGLDLSGSIQGAGGVGGVLAVSIATNSVHFAAFDGNGNLSALVSTTNGAVTATYEYSPFGETLRANGIVAKANPIRFSTQLADDVTGRKKYLHRDLTDTGRWISRDPIEEPGGHNLYGFVDNNSISSIDPFGLCKIEIRHFKLGSFCGKAWYHAYVVVSDSNGTQTYYRGGPSAGGPSSGGSGATTSGGGGSSSQNCCCSSQSKSSNSSNCSSPGCSPGGAGANTGPWGRITTVSGSYVKGTIDWDPNSSPTVVVLDDNQPCTDYKKKLQTALDQIDKANISYNPFGDNSNATAYSIVESAGFPRPKAPVWSPGSCNKLK